MAVLPPSSALLVSCDLSTPHGSLTGSNSAAWALGNIGTNITANSISSANDLTTLFPRWVNILRGQIFAVFVGVWAFAPWKVLATAGSFISFMGAYSIVLAPIGAILAADFFVVKKEKYNVPELYDPRGIYRFSHGINWRAAVALVVSIAPNMPGMIVSPHLPTLARRQSVAICWKLTVTFPCSTLLTRQSILEEPSTSTAWPIVGSTSCYFSERTSISALTFTCAPHSFRHGRCRQHPHCAQQVLPRPRFSRRRRCTCR